MAKFYFLVALFCFVWLPPSAQQVEWSRTYPEISVFSSPQAADLNGDGVRDIVIGAGAENAILGKGVIALDGVDGQELWSYPGRSQVYNTALFHDISGDGTNDVFIGGREGIFLALDGQSGEVLWEVWPDSLGDPVQGGWFQFYNAQWIADQNQDGVPELLTSNGGDPEVLAFDSLRPAGQLVVFSGLDGAVLARANVPDGHETYFSPLVLSSATGLEVLFGSGGETVRGKLWRVPLVDVLQSDLSQARVVASDTSKGFVPVASLADLNGDAVEDIVVPTLGGGKVMALDGSNDSLLWELDFPGFENYVSPTIGQFTGDPTPDVFGIIAKGRWSFYAEYIKYLVDGSSGQVVWTDTSTLYQLTQANALDWDGDGFDEIMLLDNFDIGFFTLQYRNQTRLYDFQSATVSDFGNPRIGINLFSTPLMVDLDGDQSMEMVYVHHAMEDQWTGLTGARIERMALNRWVPQLAWGGYMGNDRDGRYTAGLMAESQERMAEESLLVAPNPSSGTFHILDLKPDYLTVKDLHGRVVWQGQRSREIELTGHARGVYLLDVQCGRSHFYQKLILR